jgi:hypothetical protein
MPGASVQVTDDPAQDPAYRPSQSGPPRVLSLKAVLRNGVRRLRLATMDVVALIVAIVSAIAAVVAVWYARDLGRSAAKAADAAEKAAAATQESVALHVGHRRAELAPRFRVTLEPEGPFEGCLRLGILLVGPPELEWLDGLMVTIQDDHPWLKMGLDLAQIDATEEQLSLHVWGPYRFISDSELESDPARIAGRTGGTKMAGGKRVNEEWAFFLEPTRAPSWAQPESPKWQKLEKIVRLRLECWRGEWDPWLFHDRIDADDLNRPRTIEIP